MIRSFPAKVALSFCVLFLLAMSIAAQDLDDVTMTGRVADQNGLSIVGATVTAKHVETGSERTVVTDESGRYKLIELQPGTYSLRISSDGFGAIEKIGIQTVSGQNLQSNFTLAPADINVTQDVEVTEDDSPAVDTTRTVVGGTITSREIEEIPNFSREPLDLVLTLGGTSEESLSTSGLAEDRFANPNGTPLEQGNFSLSGGTAYSNNITIDGLDNNDDRSSRERFQPSIEAIAEVQVITNQFSAEYGRASGGRINLRTRAGGKRFRGRAFMFYRNDALNSNTWYNNANNIERLPFTEYNPGFTFSGPVILPFYKGRKRTFFSVAYEYSMFDDTTLIDAYVPVIGNPNYQLPPSTGGSQTCDANPPTPDNPACAGADPTAGFVSPYTLTYPTPNRKHIFTARVDHKLFKSNDLTVGFQYGLTNNLRTNGSSVTKLEQAFQAKRRNTQAINFTDNQVFGANVVNQFRMQWSGYKPSYETADPLDPVVLISIRDPRRNSVRTLIAGNSTTSSLQSFADSRNETRWQFQDSLSIVGGRHTIKTGLDVMSVVSKTLGLEDATGTFNFNSVSQFWQQCHLAFPAEFWHRC